VAREEITSSANIPRLAPGEKIENLSPTRPGSNFENFAKFLIRDIALGLNLPPEFVYDPASVGGAGMRFVVAKAQRRFEQRQRLLIDRFCARAWRYFIARAIAAGDLPEVADYDRVSWQTPKSLTVDAGREAMQERENYKAGLSSLADYFGELGLDWQEQVEQMAREKKFIASLNPTAPAPAAEATPEQAAVLDPVQTSAAPEELAASVTESTAMQAQVEIIPPQTEAFTMKDEPDFTLSEKEADMVAKAIGLKNKPAKKKKA
jgi:capsid protein